MGTWVISWISWHDYELHSEIIDAGSYEWALSAALRKLVGTENIKEWEDFVEGLDLSTPNDIKQEAFNVDGMVHAIKI